MMSKFSKLDTLPKRRGKEVILKDLETVHQEQRNFRPAQPGRDRNQMKEYLQDKFKYAEDEKLQNCQQIDENEIERVEFALNAKMRIEAKKKNKLILPPKQKTDADVDYAKPVTGHEGNKKLAELNGLFDAVCEEIEERQNYLEDIEKLGLKDDPKIKQNKIRIKNEITDRVAELQKINALIKKEKAGS